MVRNSDIETVYLVEKIGFCITSVTLDKLNEKGFGSRT